MRAYRVGIAGPVGSGKTALVDQLSGNLWPKVNMGVVTNDIYTKEDAEFLIHARARLRWHRIRGVEPRLPSRRDSRRRFDEYRSD